MVVVRPSGIHGMGLFASSDIPEGATIGLLEGKWVRKDGPHVLWITKKKGFRVKNDMKFINHADDPNAAYFDDLTVGALRDIRAGEEITHNYGGDDPSAYEPQDWAEPKGKKDKGKAKGGGKAGDKKKRAEVLEPVAC